MVLRHLAIMTLLFHACVSLASEPSTRIKLHNVSENIEQYANYESITDSLYQQIRPRANITNSTLSTEVVDQKVKKYISEKYAPALLMNYKHIYSQLREEKGDFSDCGNITPIKAGEDVLKALCLNEDNSVIKVKYMTNGYSQGWKTSAIFIFSLINSTLQLASIEIQLKKGVKAYVEGI